MGVSLWTSVTPVNHHLEGPDVRPRREGSPIEGARAKVMELRLGARALVARPARAPARARVRTQRHRVAARERTIAVVIAVDITGDYRQPLSPLPSRRDPSRNSARETPPRLHSARFWRLLGAMPTPKMKATGKRRGRPPAPPGTARTRRVSLRLHPVLVARVEREVALMALTSLSSFFELAAANFIEQRTTWRRELLTA